MVRRVVGSSLGASVAGTAALTMLPAPAAHAATVGQRAVSIAAAQQGDPYEWGAAGPNAFDCSGLVMYVYGQLGYSLPHSAAGQYDAVTHVSASQLEPGDIVFFYDSSGSIYHDGIYAGNGQMWVAPHSGTTVQLESIYSSSYVVGRPYGAATTSGGGSSGAGGAEPVGYAVGGGHPLLREGAHGTAVTEAQRLLGVTADGIFGPMTRAAVMRFQSHNGLLTDGVVGPRTWSALTRSSGIENVDYRYRTGGRPVLRVGSSGPAVRIVQRSVGVTVDGRYGPATRRAVKRFQSRHALTVDGVVGPLTWAALRFSNVV